MNKMFYFQFGYDINVKACEFILIKIFKRAAVVEIKVFLFIIIEKIYVLPF